MTMLASDRTDTRAQPDRDEAERFLSALDPDADRFTFQTFDDNKERRDQNKKAGKSDPLARCIHGSLAGAWDQLAALNAKGAGIFVTINLTTLEGRRSNTNILAVRAVFSDLDGAPLDPVLAEGEPKAHIVTETSPAKFHVFWLAADVPLEEFKPTQKVIAERYDSDPQVNDLPRVMRLPGFIHRKGEPFLSRLVQANDFEPYKWAELSKIFRDEWKDNKQPPKQVGGTSNWRDLNTIACARGGDWFPALFRGAYQSGDTWRVSSKALGRDLQEDIGLHPQYGIRDFGEEKSFTPIDLVAKWLPTRDARAAVEWLARRLGDNPGKYLKAISGAKSNAELLAELNRDNCVVLDGGRALVLRFERVEYSAGDETYAFDAPIFLRPNDFRTFYLNRRVQISKDESMPLGAWWLMHPQRRQYDGLVFKPGAPKVVGEKLNLWRGWGVEPKQGDWSLMKRHIKEVLCAGEKPVYDYTFKWLAWSVQKPDIPPEVAIAFLGEQGTGKGALGKATCRIFGQHARHVSSADHLTGHFNAHLRQCSFLFADEAVAPKDKAAESVLKRMITESTLPIEAKGRDRVEVPNCLHIMLASNNDWVIPAGMHERRWVVQKVSDSQRQKAEWFGPLYKQLEDGGYAAMLYDLLNVDLGDWHPRQIVPTKALADQQEQSLSALDLWWLNVLQTGVLVGADADAPHKAVSNDYDVEFSDNGFSKFKRVRGLFDAARASSPRLRSESDHAIGKYIREHAGATDAWPRRRRGWQFPPLKDCRKRWKKRYPATVWRLDLADWRAEGTT
jgi:hypothetical protein